jgi:tRNA-Thr(GGU) m(6)t(6)A37 methyltransferase TsaA
VDEIRHLLSSVEDLVPGSPAGPRTTFTVAPIGVVESSLQSLEGAPRQGSEGAPDAWIEVQPKYADGLAGIQPGDTLLVLTWLHRADRATLQVHPRDDLEKPLTGVFRTRSADRPNPIGLHPVTVREIHGCRLLVGPLEALHGTPVLDLKPVL